MFSHDERIAIFIDGSNLYATLKILDLQLDYKKIIKYFSNKGNLIRSHYYTAISDKKEHSPIRPLADWLSYNGYTVKTKPLKEFIDPITKVKKIKGNVDVEITVDMIKMSSWYDHAILFSGDGDFTYLLHYLKEIGKKVTIVSTMESEIPMLSDDLRRISDNFIDLNFLRKQFSPD